MTQDPEPWFPLRTERLLLREFRVDDFDDVHAYATDPEVVRYMHWGPNTPEVTRDVLERAEQEAAAWPRANVTLGIQLLETPRVIGSIRLGLGPAERLTADIGYCLHRAFWRQGYATEAALAVVDVAFRRLGLHRVWATCDVRNVGSQGVLQKLGMRREGLLRQDRLVKGAWRDTYLYALLDEEFAVA